MMNLERAEQIYAHPKGHTKDELTECLKTLNAIPHRLTLAEQVVIADAHDRIDILNGVIIDPEYRILPDKPKEIDANREV